MSGFLDNDHFPRVSHHSHLSGDEVKPGAMHRSHDIYLTAEENPGKPQLGESLTKAVRPVIASKLVPYESVGSHIKSRRE